MKIEQTFHAEIMGVGQVTSGEIDLPGAVEFHVNAAEIYPDIPDAGTGVVTFPVPMELAKMRSLASALYKRAKITIIIETEE